jgi:hypothetical protein
MEDIREHAHAEDINIRWGKKHVRDKAGNHVPRVESKDTAEGVDYLDD